MKVINHSILQWPNNYDIASVKVGDFGYSVNYDCNRITGTITVDDFIFMWTQIGLIFLSYLATRPIACRTTFLKFIIQHLFPDIDLDINRFCISITDEWNDAIWEEMLPRTVSLILSVCILFNLCLHICLFIKFDTKNKNKRTCVGTEQYESTHLKWHEKHPNEWNRIRL